MKKLFMILMASFALAACGGGTNTNEADRGDNMETAEPSVAPESDFNESNSDTTNTYMGDTTATEPQGTPAP